MSQINQSQIPVDGNLVAHLQRVAVDGAELVVDIHVEAIATHYADLAKSHCGDGCMGGGTTTGSEQAVAVEDHADIVRYRVGTNQDNMLVGMLFTKFLDLPGIKGRQAIHGATANTHAVTHLVHFIR